MPDRISPERSACVVSIVIAAHNVEQVIEGCLEALQRQTAAGGAEVVVADSSTDRTPALVRERFPDVRLLHFEQPLTVPELRGRGIARSAGALVAILDPYAIADPDWLEQLVRVHARRAHLVVGGAVDLHPSQQGLLAWAAYINEYGIFMPPAREGETELLPGCNLSYKREALFEGETPRFPTFWKTFVNAQLEATGQHAWLAPEVVVRLSKPIPFLDFLRTRYDHGRCFAGMRVERGGRLERLGRALSAPLLPGLLLWRWGRAFWSKGRERVRFLATLPLQLVLFSSWAWGELRGYLGGPGRCCARLFY